jgi:hypothetical protein
MKRFLLGVGSALGASGLAHGQQPPIDPQLMPVVTSIVITAPYGAPPEIRITVSSPYGGAKIHTEDRAMAPLPPPQPPAAPPDERKPTATIGGPAMQTPGVPAIIRPVLPTPNPPPSPAQRAFQFEAPYRRTPAP